MIDNQFVSRAEIFKALSHPVRLKLIDLLSPGELCVCKLVEQFDLDQSTISKHLSVMRTAGLVKTRREGTKIFYSLRMPCIKDFFACIDNLSSDSPPEKCC